MPPTNPTPTYAEYEKHLLEQMFEAWEAYSHAPSAEDSLERGDALTAALQRLTDLISTARVSEEEKRVIMVHGGAGKAVRRAGES